MNIISPLVFVGPPYSNPLPSLPFPALQPVHHVPSRYSISSTLSHSPPAFQAIAPLLDNQLILAYPNSDDKDTPPQTTSTTDEGFTFGTNINDRRASVMALTLAPITCPTSTVSIVVETESISQKFTMHRDLLCFYSPYFRAIFRDHREVFKTAKIRPKLLKREWRWEDQEDVDAAMEGYTYARDGDEMETQIRVKLPASTREIKLCAQEVGDVSRKVMAAFVNWLYHGYAGFGLHGLAEPTTQIDSATLIELWVFAGRVGVPECQNHCIEGVEWWRRTLNIIQTSMLGWVYQNTTEYARGECMLRALLIDQCAWKLDGRWLLSDVDGKKNEEQFPREALVDLVSRMRMLMNEGGLPPFLNSHLRRQAYWIEFEEKRVVDVLKVCS